MTIRRFGPSMWKAPVAAGGVILVWALVVGASGIGADAATPTTIGLGTAKAASVLAGAGVTNTGSSVLAKDLDSSPSGAITGFPPGETLGTEHAADAVAGQAQQDLTTAYNAAKAAPSTGDVTGVNLSGKTLTQGVYTASTGMSIAGNLPLTLRGGPDAVFVFQAGSTLITGAGSSVVLVGGVQACNVFWQVSSSATLGTTTAFVGNILALTSISLDNGATVAGRALARNGSVTLDDNVFTDPACVTSTPPTTTIPPSTTSTTKPTSPSTTTPTSSTTTPPTSSTTTPPTTSTTLPGSTSTTAPQTTTTVPESITQRHPGSGLTVGAGGGSGSGGSSGSGSGTVLATTGTDAEGLSLGGAGLMAAGGLLFVLSRRRRT